MKPLNIWIPEQVRNDESRCSELVDNMAKSYFVTSNQQKFKSLERESRGTGLK
jgi:hypothetical protein